MVLRAILITSVLALAATTPGCLTALAAAAGADARTISSALDADLAILGAITDDQGVAYGQLEPEDPSATYGDADTWRCVLATGEEQLVRAHSLEGARAACLMANDVDLVGEGCICLSPR